MEPLIIQVNWAYFLGIVGGLILIAWKGGGRFKAIETDVKWIIDAVKELRSDGKVSQDNKRLNAFGNTSPVALMQAGKTVLEESGLKSYIDRKTSELLKMCSGKKTTSAYEVQEHVFEMFDNIEFEEETDKKLKDYAYNKGMSIETIRRIGAIYFRDICLNNFEMKLEDVDHKL